MAAMEMLMEIWGHLMVNVTVQRDQFGVLRFRCV